MTIERRLEFLGIPFSKQKLPIGSVETLKTFGDKDLWKHPSSVPFEAVQVLSEDELYHGLGHHRYENNLIGAVVVRSKRYIGEELNSVDIKKSLLPGINVVYKWTPSSDNLPTS